MVFKKMMGARIRRFAKQCSGSFHPQHLVLLCKSLTSLGIRSPIIDYVMKMQILNSSTFSPSQTRETSVFLYTARFPFGTMASADFSDNQLVITEISLGKVNALQSNPARSTYLSFWCSLGFTMM